MRRLRRLPESQLPGRSLPAAGSLLLIAGVAKTFGLFVLTACAEILGCYLPYLWLEKDRSPLLLIPAAGSLALFVWLLTLHPTSAGRTYAAYGGVYVVTALFWLWLVDKKQPDHWDLIGGGIALIGMAVIAFAPRSA